MRLMRNRKSKEMVAVKYVEREAGAGLSKNTEREIINHRKLLHENIIRFHEVQPHTTTQLDSNWSSQQQ